ncbi:MAG: hypothetical protein ABIR92_11845, partial [Gemmatimonadaceae bacterium]
TQSGTTPSFTNTGTLSIGSGRLLTMTGGALLTTSGSIFGNGISSGRLVVTNGTLAFSTATLRAMMTLTNTAISGGAVTIGSGDTLNLSGGTLTAAVTNNGMLFAQDNATVAGSVTTNASSTIKVEGNAAFSSASLTFASGFTNNGAIILTAINAGYASLLTVTSGALVNAVGGSLISDPGPGGTRTLTADLVNLGTFSPAATIALNGTLDNQGTLTLPSNVSLTVTKPGAAHTNSGIINLTGGTVGTLTFPNTVTATTITNTGTVSVNAGRTWLVGSGNTVINAATPTVGNIIGSGGTLNFSSATAFINNGIIAPGGVGTLGSLTYTGNFAPGSGGTIHIDLGGTTSSLYDRLLINGTAALGGTMNVQTVNGYTVGPGLNHDVITSTGMTTTMVLGTNPGCSGVISTTNYRLIC